MVLFPLPALKYTLIRQFPPHCCEGSPEHGELHSLGSCLAASGAILFPQKLDSVVRFLRFQGVEV